MSQRPPVRLPDLVVCSLEAWDEVWRRNQLLVDALLRRHPGLRVLFVEPAHDIVTGLARRRLPALPRLRRVDATGRLWALRPVKPLPRVLGPWADRSLRRQVTRAACRLGLAAPLLWVNDLAYAPLAADTGWPTLYDITDDWLVETSVPARVRARRRRLEERLLGTADEVVVCSPALARSRGQVRPVTLIPNGVDVEHLARAQPRPDDLPRPPVAVYVGTLHDERFDVELAAELAARLPRLRLALVGPDALSAGARRLLSAHCNVRLLGPRPYAEIPGYLQHADVLIVPHRVNAFTDSLDPIKAYECLAVGRPTVATNVAGFRGLGGTVTAVARGDFVRRVRQSLDRGQAVDAAPCAAVSWERRAADFEVALLRAASATPAPAVEPPRGSQRQ